MDSYSIVTLGPAACDPDRFGGKGASLGRLVELGYQVPPGFVVSADILAQGLTSPGLRAHIARLTTSMEAGEPDLESASKIAFALRHEIDVSGLAQHLDSYATQLDLGDDLIIRSSAGVEDSSMHSYAGIFESIRVRERSEMAAAVTEVWASAFSPRALSYATNAGLRSLPSMAVVVQRFIDAVRAGVMFTTFTDDEGRSATLVEHVEGTAGKLVAGMVTPETLWLRGQSGDGNTGTLAPTWAGELSELAVRLEGHLGVPQDVEWCIDESSLFVVQSRPVTASPVASGLSVDGTVLTQGTAASPGVASGPVHVAFQVEQALALVRGQVLVTPMTNPDMVVAMRNAVGVVTDVGGVSCHAAIVSRELQIPCVVGTGDATRVLPPGNEITVDGSGGRVYEGVVRPTTALPPVSIEEIWAAWAASDPDGVPVVDSMGFVVAAPPDVENLIYVVDGDLRCDEDGLWRVLDQADVRYQLRRLADELSGDNRRRARIATRGAVDPVTLNESCAAAGLSVADDQRWQPDAVAAQIATSVAARAALRDIETSILRSCDPRNVPGGPPQIRPGAMPSADSRALWWDLLPEYGRFLRGEREGRDPAPHAWIEIRPEVITSPMLKSLVLPGFEMVPRVLGFDGLPPMHTKWIRGRFHVRADTFEQTWETLVRRSWDRDFMEGLLRRVRASYAGLADVVHLFPQSDEDATELTNETLVALVTSWWPRWVEFFSLCLFIQAQGEQVLYPVLEEMVSAGLRDLPPPPPGRSWPDLAQLVAPTTSVLSAEYMQSLSVVTDALAARGIHTIDTALQALREEASSDLATAVDDHLADWHWMRDRDLLFDPWDTPQRVLETALGTERHQTVSYENNLSKARSALAFHTGLASEVGRARLLEHGARFLQDLNVERENHHVLWLKYSYPLRRILLEAERRLTVDGLAPGWVFFSQAPELLALLRQPSSRPSEHLVRLILERRRAYRHETQLERSEEADLYEEDDYF